MTERNGRDADLDPERFAPRVVPIRGFTLPPPPGWSEVTGHVNDAVRLRGEAETILTPDDYTVAGALRCTYLSQSTGTRCGNALVTGTSGCSYHNSKYRHYSNYEQLPHPDDPNPKPAQESRADRVERIRAHLETAGQAAVAAVMAVLEDEFAKPGDRLKAAEIVLDRTVGRQLAVEKQDSAERDLDIEIMELADNLLPATGTDGPGVGSSPPLGGGSGGGGSQGGGGTPGSRG